MAEKTWRQHPLWTLLARPALLSVPFAFFFLLINNGKLSQIHEFYIVAFVFGFFVNLAVQANGAWIVPHLPGKPDDAESRPIHALHVGSYAVMSMLGSLAAAAVLQFTIMPGILSSARHVLQILMFAVLFTALFLGVIYAVLFQKRLAVEIERKTREAHEMSIAAGFQQAFLPHSSPTGTWYAASGESIPCRAIGGDFFTYFDLPGGRVGFALADVAGKGPPAAILAAMSQGIFESHARTGDSPAATLARVNEAIAAREIEARFVTMFYAILGPSGDLVFTNAGHNPPVVLRRRNIVGRLEKGGLMIGPFKGATFEEEASQLEPGDVLVVYSDGVTDAESPSGEQFGEERLVECLGGPLPDTAEAVRDHLLNAVRAFAADRPLFDDVTVLAVRYLGPSAS